MKEEKNQTAEELLLFEADVCHFTVWTDNCDCSCNEFLIILFVVCCVAA